MSVACVVGVPLGAVIVDHFGWRARFALAAALALVAAAGVGLLPAVSNPTSAGSLYSRFAVVGRPVVLATLAVIGRSDGQGD
jgi:MFS transporter, DHA1 family, inner membrane transport protein